MTNAKWLLAAAASLMITVPALAQDTGQSTGEVRKIDRSAAKVTLRHGPIQGLDMPGMTMVFQVRDRALLDKLKEGERIKFTTTREGGAFILRSFEPEK